MQRPPYHATLRPAAAALGATLAACALAACGGSSPGSPSSPTLTVHAATTGAGSGTGSGGGSGGGSGTGSGGGSGAGSGSGSGSGSSTPGASARIALLRECLEKNGISLPKSGAGQIPVAPPSGISRARYAATLKKCSAQTRAVARRRHHLASPAVRSRLARFAACMSGHGVKLPPPNTSGNGPVFRTRGLNMGSPGFTTAVAACRPILLPQASPGGDSG